MIEDYEEYKRRITLIKLDENIFSYSELSEIRAKSVEEIRKIREQINFRNIIGSDKPIDNKNLRTLQRNF